MPQYEFQIITRTEAESEQFMTAIGAEDVDIEIWIEDRDTPTHREECIAFGLTTLSPEELERRTTELGVQLVYVENVEEADQKADALIQQVMQASEIVYSREPTPGKTRLSEMLEIHKQISDEMEM
ncbi:hypothetical protein [Pseudanabaena sp. FACHB-2040]|uniref:hypothetical protein n=1 Tax=Pseudanabaena sp. FACHB-2040 TaxID=2692859 RepID=UPI00168A1DB0|nr:hypothetical protein [Pseudanabaena sp. FACHB-2040]MBD2261073.1 hypothetical protein [Pseudanabaena sp. FACHB-2040]